MPKHAHYEIGCFFGDARTKTEARKIAEESVKNAMDSYQPPTLIFWRGHIGLIYRYVPNNCWASATFWPGRINEKHVHERNCSTQYGNSRTYEHVVDSVKYHLVQLAWETGREPDDEELEFLNEHYACEFKSWTSWQNAVERALKHGLDPDQARRYADHYQKYTVEDFVRNVLDKEIIDGQIKT